MLKKLIEFFTFKKYIKELEEIRKAVVEMNNYED